MMTFKSAKNLLQINARMEKWNYMLTHDNLRGYVWQLFAEKKSFMFQIYIKNQIFNQ